eukprot:CAMPEP_0197873862 /NCGR_PEP_ID=MMETSP1439-20131203/3522_1 /TAXON_ID=66791 /ORGANISM="Gonyaulax spinifera, Strain CCMP409" /LENGTH=118 /DNA_ID=CAMNT_0043492933 /DNA_START=47 /DNA_END=403 /DNA_ORIENTATION=+
MASAAKSLLRVRAAASSAGVLRASPRWTPTAEAAREGHGRPECFAEPLVRALRNDETEATSAARALLAAAEVRILTHRAGQRGATPSRSAGERDAQHRTPLTKEESYVIREELLFEYL